MPFSFLSLSSIRYLPYIFFFGTILDILVMLDKAVAIKPKDKEVDGGKEVGG